MNDLDQNREKLERKVADAKHMSKPDAENAVVVRDADGRWIFEIYTAGHRVEGMVRFNKIVIENQ
ncbi:MAG: hypothetical protein HOI35_01805 [Woeseia sp.]|jgi:hypothetical protein|nr:hypothetical protein [Woeseia sp.]MBT6208743.1 hypothetical protein [Woeseia sp.]